MSKVTTVLQNAGLPSTETGGLLAALGVLLAWATDFTNLVGLLALGGFFLFDMIAGMGKAYNRSPQDWYDGNVMIHGLVRKMLKVMLVLIAGMMDGLTTLIPALAQASESLTPVTKTVLSALIVGEIGSILQNIRKAGVSNPALDLLSRRIGGEETKDVPTQKRPRGGGE